MTSEKKVKKITTPDKSVIYIWDNKFHNWEGPAYIPQGDKKKAEYYINGIKYSKEKWKELKKDREGLPYYKQSSFKNRF
jgi:hypothetical protein